MQSAIRIVKRGSSVATTALSANEVEKTVQQREHETVNTVKSWIAEWEQRKRSLQAAAFELVRSLENSRQNSAQAFAVTNVK